MARRAVRGGANRGERAGGRAALGEATATAGAGADVSGAVPIKEPGITVQGKDPVIPDTSAAGTEGTTWGWVESYAVDQERLMIKLNASAISHLLIALRVDEPHFRTAVSMTMMAFHTAGVRLTVRYFKPNPRFTLGQLEVLQALEVGIGNEPKDALAYEDWPIHLPPR